jgi:hypothetical protein
MPPPKLVENQPNRGPARQAAWACLLSNLALPGLGTLVARRRVAGLLQLVISQIGFALCVLWSVLFLRDWIRQGSLPEDITPHLGLALIGPALFFLAWIWSLASSVEILIDSRKSSL